MTITPEVEKCARAICVRDGCDPDFESIALGVLNIPKGQKYKLWETRIPAAIACLEALLEPSEAMVDEAYDGVSFTSASRSEIKDGYRAMLLKALGRRA